jgi:hypothetical protein
LAPAMPSLGGVGRDFVSGRRVSAFDTRRKTSEGVVVVEVIEASGLLWTPTDLAYRTPIGWATLKRNFVTVTETARANGRTLSVLRSVFQKCRSNVRISRNCRVNSAGATVRNNTVGTTASATSGNNIGITGAREVRDISTNTTASVQFVRAKLVGTAAGVQANRVNLVGTIAIPRFGNSNATARGRTHRTDAMATNRLGRRADVPSGHLGKVRARLEVGQARRLGGTVLGRRAIALGSHRILRRGAIVLNIHMGRGQVAGAGQARSLGVTARTRLGRARKSATNLLGLEAAIRR